jgi:hypothetical protein
MAVFDPANLPSQPDSTLDSAISLSKSMKIQGGATCDIAPGDWLDIDPAVCSPDPNWGYSFQCAQVYDDGSVDVLASMDNGNTYFPMNLGAGDWVQNNFRRVPTT